jgi:hypothetical protein
MEQEKEAKGAGSIQARRANNMTITLSPQTEALLKEQAGRLGQDADTLADRLLHGALMEAARDFEESCAAIAEALESDPANDISFEEYQAQFEAEREARRQKRAAAPVKAAPRP